MIILQNLDRFKRKKAIRRNTSKTKPLRSAPTNWASSFIYLEPVREKLSRTKSTLVQGLTISSANLDWPDASPEQLRFVRAVYDINFVRINNKTFVNDVPESELSVVEGRFKLRTEAAKSAKEMLKAIQDSIESGQKNVTVRLSSAYRSASHQFKLWNEYVTNQYYPDTKNYRKGLEGGEHGEKAAKYLARYTRIRIATPGYSNHNNGHAIDFLNKEGGKTLKNKTNQSSTDQWRNSWLWKWLTENAAKYNFFQNNDIDEPWHWVYRESLSSGQTKLWNEDTKFQWINEKLQNKTLIIDESGHNLSLLPFPAWIDKTKFQNDFKSKYGADADTILGNTTVAVTANYFVIHDTAATNKATSSNKPSNTTGIHMWLNNDGAYRTHDWNHRGDGTKVERGNNGCFVHTELVRHPKLDQAVAGIKKAGTYYTDLQYELLAYAYAVCSMRKGSLLEVTVHRVVDLSLKNGHNDPQHFDMNRFYSLVDGILKMPISKLHPPLRDFTYGVEHSRIMQHRQDNWSGYRNEFIPYVESQVDRAEQYRPMAKRRNSAGQVISDDYLPSTINMTRYC